MEEKKINGWVKFLIVLIIFLFVIPMLSAILAINFPLSDLFTKRKAPYKTYEGTEYSFFYTKDPEKTQQDFEDIAYYFQNHEEEWKDEIHAIINAATNPGEAAEIIKDELHLDISNGKISKTD